MNEFAAPDGLSLDDLNGVSRRSPAASPFALAPVVADVARLLPGASRTTRIHVLSLTAVVRTSVRTDLIRSGNRA
jgi:hypothetical protein